MSEHVDSETVNWRSILTGAILVVIGLLWSVLFFSGWSGFFPRLIAAIDGMDQALLILTTAQVVLINTFRTLPYYLGTFLVADELHRAEAPWGRWLGIAAPMIVLALVYLTAYLLRGVNYGLILPALFAVLCITITGYMRNVVPRSNSRALILIVLMSGFQWLGVMPIMQVSVRGWGDISSEIKLVARFMRTEAALDFIGLLFIGFTLVVVALLIRLSVIHTRELEQERLAREQEQELQKMKMAVLEANALGQVRSLTHDLKTPLTTIQGLSSILQLMVEDQVEQAAAICERINQAAEDMNEKINDILRQKRRQPIDVRELINFATAQVSPKQGISMIQVAIEDGLPRIAGNRTRLVRALCNVLENSLQALAETGGTVQVSARALSDHRVRIVVLDDGPGIANADKPNVFNMGFSTKGTAGLGLPFVSEVIRDHGGTIDLWSVPGVGTKVVITLPEVIEN